jgi:hypothetical protein
MIALDQVSMKLGPAQIAGQLWKLFDTAKAIKALWSRRSVA